MDKFALFDRILEVLGTVTFLLGVFSTVCVVSYIVWDIRYKRRRERRDVH